MKDEKLCDKYENGQVHNCEGPSYTKEPGSGGCCVIVIREVLQVGGVGVEVHGEDIDAGGEVH